jgi:hypothetical protein
MQVSTSYHARPTQPHHIFLRHAHALPPHQPLRSRSIYIYKKYKQILDKMMHKDERKPFRSAFATIAVNLPSALIRYKKQKID